MDIPLSTFELVNQTPEYSVFLLLRQKHLRLTRAIDNIENLPLSPLKARVLRMRLKAVNGLISQMRIYLYTLSLKIEQAMLANQESKG